MERNTHKHSRRRPEEPGVWYNVGRALFPELAHHPRTLRARMLLITLGLAALLVGALAGYYHRTNTPDGILMIQARELNR